MTLRDEVELELYRYAQNGYKSKEHVEEARKSVKAILQAIRRAVPEKKNIPEGAYTATQIGIDIGRNKAISEMLERLDLKEPDHE